MRGLSCMFACGILFKCACVPKYLWSPPSLFFVKVGAPLRLALIAVPTVRNSPSPTNKALTVAKICSASLYFSSRWRKRWMLLASGLWPCASISSILRHSGTAQYRKNPLLVAGPDKVKHCCLKCKRCIARSAIDAANAGLAGSNASPRAGEASKTSKTPHLPTPWPPTITAPQRRRDCAHHQWPGAKPGAECGGRRC